MPWENTSPGSAQPVGALITETNILTRKMKSHRASTNTTELRVWAHTQFGLALCSILTVASATWEAMIHLHTRFENSPRGNCDSGSCRTKPTPGSVDLNSTFGPSSKMGQTDLSPVAFQFAGAVLLTGCHQPVPFADSHQGATWLQQSLDQGRRRAKNRSLEWKTWPH